MNNDVDDLQTRFAPVLYFTEVAPAIQFYQAAFGATELRRWGNDDGSVHVAEMVVNNAMFHLHEETPGSGRLSPATLNGTPVEIGLFVNDPDAFTTRALAAGAVETHPMQDYDYGYRQASFTDPFGHQWTIQKKIP